MDRSRTIRASRLRPLHATLGGLTLLPLMLLALAAVPAGAKPGNDNRAPDLGDACEKLEVGAGHKVAFEVYAEGVQVYRWDGNAWVFVGPEALLFADDGGHGVVGVHYGGPTWESNSGSTVVGAVLERCTVDPDAIPWLKLAAKSSGGPGVFDGIKFIQRVNTVGGLPPAEDGTVVGEEARVPYAADYYFYRAARH